MAGTFWNAVGALAGIGSVVVGVYFGIQSVEKPGKDKPDPPSFGFSGRVPPPPPTPSPATSNCISIRMSSCDTNAEQIAAETLDKCRAYVVSDTNNPVAYSLIGRAYRALGRLDEAEQAFEIQLRLGVKSDDRETIASAQYNLSTIHLRRGLLDRAESAIHRSLENTRLNSPGRAANLKSLGDIAYRRGSFVEAENHFRQSFEIAEKLDDKLAIGGAYTGFGFSRLRNRDRATGCAYLQKARKAYLETSCTAAIDANGRHLVDTRCQ